MQIVGLVLTLLLIVVGTAFAALNSKSVAINYLLGSKELPLALVMLVSMSVGIIISLFFLGVNIIKLKARNKSLENKLKRSQETT